MKYLNFLGDVARGMELVSWGLEFILCIRRLRRSFRGAHGCSAPPPSPNSRISSEPLGGKTVGWRGRDGEGGGGRGGKGDDL